MDQLTLERPVASKKPALNQGQQEAADAFFQFLFSDEKEMGVSGPGGYGKTHLMGHLIDEVMPRYFETCQLMGLKPQYDEVVMTATTNKASEQLSQATGRYCETIHMFLNLKVQDDYTNGTTKLTRKNTWKVHERKIVFVDECSMEDTQLYRNIHEAAKDCKIVHVGDHCQLAPVMETLSPVYRQGIPFYNLTQPMRNVGQPALMALCQQLRNTVETGVFKPIQIVPGVIDWMDDDDVQIEIERHFKQQTHSSKIIAYTNNRVIQFNDHIRGLRQLPDHYTVGEQLISSTAAHLRGGMLNVEQEVEILKLADTSDFVPIEEDVSLEIRKAEIRTSIGTIFTDVPLPVDRAHFTALVKHYAKVKNWERHFHLKNMYPDLRPIDASTVYKAQGSTYDTVFIDLGNISTCNNANQVARMLYVAVTRPRNRIVLYGSLAEKYGGLIQ